MKNWFSLSVLILSLLVLNSNLYSQLSINKDSVTGIKVNGMMVQHSGIDGASGENIFKMYVTNLSSSTQDLMVTRRIIEEPTDWINYLCWGGTCYGARKDVVWSSEKTKIKPNEHDAIDIYYSGPSDGTAHYRYYISTDGVNFIDSVDITISMVLTSLEQNAVSIKPSVMIFPNPANSMVKIVCNEGFKNGLLLLNSQGKIIERIANSNSSQIQFDTSNLSEGVYFIKELDGLWSKKLLITHH